MARCHLGQPHAKLRISTIIRGACKRQWVAIDLRSEIAGSLEGPRRPQVLHELHHVLNLIFEDHRTNFHASEVDVRPPGAPTGEGAEAQAKVPTMPSTPESESSWSTSDSSSTCGHY